MGARITAVKAAYVTFDGAAFGDDRSAGRDQVFPEFGLEVFALVHLAGVQGILELDDEAGTLRNGVGRSTVALIGAGYSRTALRRRTGLSVVGPVVLRTRLEHRIVLIVRASIVLCYCTNRQRQQRGAKTGLPDCLHRSTSIENACLMRCSREAEKLPDQEIFSEKSPRLVTKVTEKVLAFQVFTASYSEWGAGNEK